MVQCAQNVAEVLAARGFSKSISHDKLLKDPSCKDFFDIFRFLIAQVDPGLEVEGRMEDEVPAIMRRLKYPVEVNRSKLQAISGPNTWPQLLAVLDWLAVLVRISEGLITPLAQCEASLVDGEGVDDENHVILRCIHENYVQFIHGREDKSDEENLKQVYEERTECVRQEIMRLQECLNGMEQRLGDYASEHERLLELQRTPALMEREAENLRAALLSYEARVQRVEAETTSIDAEERAWELQDQEVRATARRLTEQVQNQAYSKKDVERLKYERARNGEVIKELLADGDRVEQDVWELKQKESRRAEGIQRTVRQVNELLESLSGAFQDQEAVASDLSLRVDLSEPNDSLAAQDFTELADRLQTAAAANVEAAQQGEGELVELQDELRAEQEDLALKDRECRHLRDRLEQLGKIREQFRDWSAAQLEEARITAEATEDAVHAVAVGTAAPTIRDSAEIDKLRLTLNAIKTQGAGELQQLREQVQRDEERFEEHRRGILKQLDGYTKDVEDFLVDFESRLEDDSAFGQARRAARLRGGA